MINNNIKTYEEIVRHGTDEMVKLSVANLKNVKEVITAQLKLIRSLKRIMKKADNVDAEVVYALNNRRRLYCQLYVAFRNIERDNKLAA